MLEICEHVSLEDGRLLISNKGIGRFEILNIIKENPILLCEISKLEDLEINPDQNQEVLFLNII